jgi:hypothetical protein
MVELKVKQETGSSLIPRDRRECADDIAPPKQTMSKLPPYIRVLLTCRTALVDPNGVDLTTRRPALTAPVQL